MGSTIFSIPVRPFRLTNRTAFSRTKRLAFPNNHDIVWRMGSSETLRRYTFRLYPNATQETRMREALRFHCDLYNAALQERRDAYKIERKSISVYDQNKSLTAIRHEHPSDYGRWSCAASQETLRRLDKAFKAFFRRVKAGETPGFPRFKSINRYSGWGYSTYGSGWKLVDRPGASDKSRLSLYCSDIGTIRMRGTLERSKT